MTARDKLSREFELKEAAAVQKKKKQKERIFKKLYLFGSNGWKNCCLTPNQLKRINEFLLFLYFIIIFIIFLKKKNKEQISLEVNSFISFQIFWWKFSTANKFDCWMETYHPVQWHFLLIRHHKYGENIPSLHSAIKYARFLITRVSSFKEQQQRRQHELLMIINKFTRITTTIKKK